MRYLPSTVLSRRLDPGDYAQVAQRHLHRVEKVVTRYGADCPGHMTGVTLASAAAAGPNVS